MVETTAVMSASDKMTYLGQRCEQAASSVGSCETKRRLVAQGNHKNESLWRRLLEVKVKAKEHAGLRAQLQRQASEMEQKDNILAHEGLKVIELEEELESLRSNRNDLQLQLDASEQHVTELQKAASEHDNLNSSLSKSRARCSKLEAKFKEIEGLLGQANTKIKESDDEKQAARADFIHVQGQRNDLQARLDAKRSALRISLQAKSEALKEQDALEKDLKDKEMALENSVDAKNKALKDKQAVDIELESVRICRENNDYKLRKRTQELRDAIGAKRNAEKASRAS